MRRALLLLFFVLGLGVPAKAQFTTATATPVKDPSGAPYVNCRGNGAFVPSPTATQVPLLSGSTFQTDVSVSSCDSFGNMSITLADNNAITDGHTGSPGSQWRLNISSQDGKTNFSCTLTITGATQDITPALQACAAPLPPAGGGGGNFVVKSVPCASTMVFTMAGVSPNTSNTAFTTTLNCSVTSSSVAPPSGGTIQQGSVAQFTLTQNNVGGFPFAWPSNFIDQPSIQVAANSTTNASFWYDGTNWHAQTFPAAGGGGGNSAGVSGDVQKSTGTGAFAVAGINDDGTTVKVAEDTQFKGPNPSFDVTRYGVRYIASPGSTTANCTASSTTVTLTAAVDFINGDGIYLGQCGPATTLSTPAAPSSVNQRAVANGATTRSYKIVAEDFSLGLTPASAATSSAVTAATLGGFVTATLSSQATSNGITTYTTAANHNLAVGAQVLIGINVPQVLTVPSATTFTVRIPGSIDQSSVSASGSVTVASHIQVYWTGQANVMRYWIYRQDGGAGNFNLVGVAQGSEPFYDDYGWNAPAAPAYVPATAPATATNQSIATKIVSGGTTTTLVVANAASNSISGVQALHDDTVAMQATYAAATAATGGRIYVPKASVNIPTLTFNFPMKFSGGAVPTQIELAGSITANQPISVPGWMTLTGVGENTGFSPAFGKNFYSLINGAGYPLIYTVGSRGSMRFDHVYVYPSNEQQWGILSDNQFGAGGTTDMYIVNSNLQSAKASGIAVVIRGVGFRYTITNDVIGNQNGVFYSQGGLRLMGSAVSAPTGIPGIGILSDSTFLAVGVKVDMEALNGVPISNVGSPWKFKNIFTESLVQSLFDIRNVVSNNWFNWAFEEIYGADTVSSGATVDMTGSFNISGLYIKGGGAGTGGITFNAGPNSGGLYYEDGSLYDSKIPSPGYAALSYNAINIGAGLANLRAFETDGGLRLKSNGLAFAELAAPTNVAGSVAAGGSVPTGTWTYRVTAVGWNGGESAPSNVTTPQVVTGGNQTVNLTWNASGIGTQGYYIYRSNGGGYARVGCAIWTSTSLSDTNASACGTSMGTASGTGPSYMNATEISAPIHRFPSSGGALFKTDMSAGTLTANRSITWADASGTPALGAPFTTNGILFGNGTSLIQATAASGAGTFCLTETNGGTPVFGSCAGSAATAWSSLTNPSADLSLNMSTFNSLFTSGVMTGTRHAWEFVDGNSTSTGSLLNLHTGATSTMKPFTATAQGTANGVQMDTTGNLAPIGTGKNTANAFTGLSTNLLLYGNGTGGISSLTGSLIGTNPVLKLTSASTGNVPFALDTPASPTADILDININAVKTSWVDNLGIWHAPSYTATGSGALALSGTEATCPTGAPGIDILCIGNLTTHTIQSSLNGALYKDIAQFSNSGPAAHGVCLVGAIFPQLNCTPAGSSGQAFISGGAGADGAYGVLGAVGGGTGNATNTLHGVGMGEGTAALNFSAAGTAGQAFISGGAGADGAYGTFDLSLGTNTVNPLPINRGGTGAATLAAANIATVTGAITPNNCVKWSSATVITDSGGTCGGAGGSARLDQLLGGTATNTINSTIFPQTWNWALTGSTTAFKRGENTAATGTTNILDQVTTLSGSTAVVAQWDNNGNGYRMGSAGLLQPVGTGTFATPGAANNLVVSRGSSTAVSYIPPVAAGKVLIDNGPGVDPSFQDPIVSQAFVNIWTTQDVTTTRTSAAIRNPIFSQTGTLELTWASITGSPATCTLQIQGVDSVGNALNNGSTFSVSPANGTTSQTFTAAAALQTAAQIKAIFACGTYPTAGTLTLDFTPIPNVNVTNTVAVSAASLPLPTGASTSAKQPALGTAGSASADVITVQGIASMTKLLVTPDANVKVNVVGNAGANVDGATGAAPPANVLFVGGLKSGATGGFLTGITACDSDFSVNISTATTTLLVTGVSGRQVRICSINLVTAGANNVAPIEGTGATCGTGTAGMAGGTTAASGWNFAANGGLTQGSGLGEVMTTVTAGDSVCLVTSAATQLSGHIKYTIY